MVSVPGNCQVQGRQFLHPDFTDTRFPTKQLTVFLQHPAPAEG